MFQGLRARIILLAVGSGVVIASLYLLARSNLQDSTGLFSPGFFDRDLIILEGFLVVTLALLGVLSYALIRSIVAPLEALQTYTRELHEGRYDQELEDWLVQRGDEIGDLASAFQKMTRSVHTSHKKLEAQVTEQTKELKRLKLAIESASDMVVITDANGTILYANPALEQATGYTVKEVLGKKAGSSALWGGQMNPEFYEALWQKIKDGKKQAEIEFENKRRNGSIYTAKASISPVLNETGEVEFFVSIERDITQEKAIERAKTEFVSLASHQLRTPLSSMKWYSEMLLAGDAGKISKKQQEFLDVIYTSNERMIKLVNALLNVTRIELGTFAMNPQPIDIRDVCASVEEEFALQIKSKALDFTSDCDNTEDVTVEADTDLLRIVVQNLVSNAVKYTPKGGDITVSVTPKDSNVEITVTDTGLGIPSYQQDKIFTKLFRADNAQETDAVGTGLGLYITKSIIEQSGGTIDFHSTEGVGTKFVVTWPREMPHEARNRMYDREDDDERRLKHLES